MSPKQFVNRLAVMRFESRQELGKAAADAVAQRIKEILKQKQEVNMLFAAAPSQNEFLEALVKSEDIEWHRINAFHMDEYIGLDFASPQSFSNFLKRAIFDRVPFKSVNCINTSGDNIEWECNRYGELLKVHSLDISCIGIGENGHIAFNDPHVADFNDNEYVKIVHLDEKSRVQQVHDGCFKSLDDVPQMAVTVTIPVIMSSEYIACIVPGETKAEAARNTLIKEISETWPSTILRKHKAAILYVDAGSAKLI